MTYRNLPHLRVAWRLSSIRGGNHAGFLFMTDESLNRFRSTDRWPAGGDASVAVLQIGANGTLDTSTATGQVNASC